VTRDLTTRPSSVVKQSKIRGVVVTVVGERGEQPPVNTSEGQRRFTKCFRYQLKHIHFLRNHFSISKCAKDYLVLIQYITLYCGN